MTIQESVILEVSTAGAVQESQRLLQVFDRLTGAVERIEKKIDDKTQASRELEAAEKRVGTETGRTVVTLERQARALERNQVASQRAARSIGEAARSYAASAQGAQAALSPITRLAALFGAGLGIRAVVQDLAAFDRGLTQVRVVSGGTAAEIDRIKQAALELGATTPKSASEALQGAVELAKAGFSALEIPEALPAALNLAVTAQLELGRAAEITAVSLKQFGLEADEAVRVTDALTVAASSGVVDVADLAEALTYAGTIGGAFGFQLEDVVAALGALGEGGLKGGIAGRGLAGVLARLLDPSKDAAEALEKIGMTTDELNPSVVGFDGAIRNLSRALSQGANVFALFDTEQAKSAVTLAKQVDAFERFAAAQRESVDAAGEQVKAFGGDLQGALTTFSSALDGLTKKAGDQGLTGALKNLVGFSTQTVQSLGGLGREGDEIGRGAQFAASAVEGLVAALASLAVLRVGTGLLAALTNPWTALAAAVGGAITLLRDYDRQVDQLRLSSVKLTEETEKAFQRIEKFRSQAAAIGQSGALVGPITQEDSLDRQTRVLDIALQAAASLRRELDAIGTGQSLPRAVESTDALAQQMERARKAVADARLQLDLATKPLREIQGLTTEQFLAASQQRDPSRTPRPSEEALNRRIGALKSAEDTLKNIEAAAVRVGDRILVPTVEVRPLAAALGTLEQLDEAESRATAGFADLVDVLRVLEGGALQGTQQLEEARKKLEEIRGTSDGAADALERLADATAAIREFDRATQDIRDQADAARSAAESGRDYAAAIRDVQDAQEARAQIERVVADLTRDGARITDEQRAAVELAIRTYVEETRALDDLTASLDEQAKGREAVSRAAERERQQAEAAAQRAQQQALQVAQDAASRADQILTALRLEQAAYAGTREAVESLALEEDLRHLQVAEQTKERIRLALEEAQALRQIREVGAGIAGGVGDAVRKLAETGDAGEAGRALLEGASNRVFESSLARIEEAIAASFTDLFTTPTIGETAIEVATRSVEGAVNSGTAQIVAAIGQAQSISVSTSTGGTAGLGNNVAGPGDPGFQGPPVPERAQASGGVGGAVAGAALGLGLGLLASRLGRGDQAEDPRRGEVGFEVIGAGKRGIVYDQRRVTQFLTPRNREQPRTRRQLAEERLGRR